MPSLGEQPDLLRALGRTFDEARASGIEITIHEAFLTVSWTTPGRGSEQRSLQEVDLEQLRDEARGLRRAAGHAPSNSFSEMLRTLGQALSDEQVEASSIIEEAEGFRVSGAARGRYTRQLYRKAELRRLSEKRSASRGRRPFTSLSARLEGLSRE